MEPDLRNIIKTALCANRTNANRFGRVTEPQPGDKRSRVVCKNFLYLYLIGKQDMGGEMIGGILRELGVEIHLTFHPNRFCRQPYQQVPAGKTYLNPDPRPPADPPRREKVPPVWQTVQERVANL